MSFASFIGDFFYRAAMAAGTAWCHQIPERSPHMFGMQGPLCWRCSGILLGIVFLLVYLFTVRRMIATLTLSLALAFLLPLDVLIGSFGFYEGENIRRLVTGILWGVFGANAFLLLAALIVKQRPALKRRET